MAAKQGIRRLRRGIVRKLSVSEVKRGYVFISVDRQLKTIFNPDNIDVVINGKEYKHRKIDKWGRIQIPKETIKTIGTERTLRIVLIPEQKIQISTTF